MMIKIISILLVIISGILCSGTQGVSSTQSGQTLQIQPNVRKYNKHTATEKPCTTGSTTGTRKDKPDNSEAQDYVPVGGPAGGVGYAYPPYPYPPYPAYAYPYPPVAPTPAGGVVLVQPGGGSPAYRPPLPQYPYEPQYPVETAQYYAPPYYPAGAGPSPLPPPPPYYVAPPYSPASQSLYEQSVVVDAYRSPYPQPGAEQQFFRQSATGPVPPYHNNYASSPHFRAHTYSRPAIATQSFLLQQRDATATVTPTATNAASANNNNNNNNAEPQYEQQQSGPFDSNQFHF